MSSGPVIKEILVNAPAWKVWKAITDKDEMKHWYFTIENFKPEVGFEFSFYGEKDQKKYPTSCKIIEVKEGQKISYTWRYDEFPVETIVTFELFDEGDKTKIRLTHEGLEKIPAEYPEASRTNHIEGWNFIIGTSLKNYVEGIKEAK